MPPPLRAVPAGRLTRPLLAVAAITFIVALAGVNARATYGTQVTADEPQYLLTALSLAEDLDLDISDELADERFLDFHEVALNPQTIELNASGQRLSPHDPGLPVLLAIPMRLGGWQLAKGFLALIAAGTAAMTAWVAIRRFGSGIATSTTVTVGLFATPPLTSYATQIYPEMPAALAVIVAVAGITDQRRSVAWRIATVVAIACLPWLAVKYAPVAAVLAVGLYVTVIRPRDRRSVLAASALTAAFAVLGAVYLLVHQRVYGGWTVYSAGDHFVDGEFLVVGTEPDYLGRSRRLIGLMVDRGFGLAAWAPAYLLAVPAVVTLVRRRTSGWLLLVAAGAAGWAVATWIALTMHGWWWPGRQTVVVLPLAVVAIANLIDGRDALRRVFVFSSVVAAINWLWLVFETSSERRTLIVDFTETSSPLYRFWSQLLPDHRRFEAVDIWLTIFWALALGVAGWVSWREAARRRVETDQAADAELASTGNAT